MIIKVAILVVGYYLGCKLDGDLSRLIALKQGI